MKRKYMRVDGKLYVDISVSMRLCLFGFERIDREALRVKRYPRACCTAHHQRPALQIQCDRIVLRLKIVSWHSMNGECASIFRSGNGGRITERPCNFFVDEGRLPPQAQGREISRAPIGERKCCRDRATEQNTEERDVDYDFDEGKPPMAFRRELIRGNAILITSFHTFIHHL